MPRFMKRTDKWMLSLSIFLLNTPSILFIVAVGPWSWIHISPAIVMIFAYVYLQSNAFLLSAAFLNPGELPIFVQESDDEPGRSSSKADQHAMYPFSPESPTIHPRKVTINGVEITLKYCTTCNLYRPPRTSHCRTCGHCVEIHDHHCPWIANCVGRRNYASFFGFIATAYFLLIFSFSISAAYLAWKSAQFSTLPPTADPIWLRTIQELPAPLIICVVCGLFFFSISGLFWYHVYLISKNMTTHEQIRLSNYFDDLRPRHPFDTGSCLRNAVEMLCRPLGPSYPEYYYGSDIIGDAETQTEREDEIAIPTEEEK